MDKHMEEVRSWDALRQGQKKPEGSDSVSKIKRSRKIRTGLYTAIAIMLVMSAAMGTAWAYFTTYARARGGVLLNLGHEEHIDETFKEWEKTLDIEISADSEPVYLRARAFCADYDVTFENSQNWTEDGDWMYYNFTLEPGKDGDGNPIPARLSDRGDELKALINEGKSPENAEEGKIFNVIIVYESTQVQYDDDGNPIAPIDADWTREVKTTRKSTDLGGDN